MFGWFKSLKRTRITDQPFPDGWQDVIDKNVRHYASLTAGQQARVRRIVQVFVEEKNWEGCGGQKMTNEIRITVAALVGILVAGLPQDSFFDHVLSILVYPTTYLAPQKQMTSAGVVIEGRQPRLGEAWWQGPVVLAWDDVLAGGRGETEGSNLVFHEFAHQLDMMNGREVDGTPPLTNRRQLDRWVSVLGPAYERLAADCRHGRHRFLDCYGATNPAEFFAVVTETFFERGESLQHLHPDVYKVVSDYYGLDPATWGFFRE